ncbi:30S ribosomal protein S2 [Sphingobacteriales bacterium UPWRP_1]|nr:30S ribosomal protein S2 [Sphingobacteriales bacterium TSM_CSS]PSJ76952.1 30S ribosomal protein S2 [Sphingobacteriales bacterium UPWRP_1]
MSGLSHQEMLDASVHFGHLRKKWNPKMLPYIFMERKGIHIIDLNKTNEGLERAASAMKKLARAGKKILFVATKKQAKDMVAKAAEEIGMPYVTERWLGGMLTNFSTIRKSIKKKQSIKKLLEEKSTALTKKERLMLSREYDKLDRILGGVEDMSRAPSALFIVDISHEHIALAEAKRLGIITFAMVDTNSDPTQVDFAIPANDDASKSVGLITGYLVNSIKEGLAERQKEKTDDYDTHEQQGEGDSGSAEKGNRRDAARNRNLQKRRRNRTSSSSEGGEE